MTLPELATRLNSRHPGRGGLPPVLLLTDDARLPDPLPAATGLPRGAGVVLRHYGDPDRAALALELAALCRRRGLRLLIAADGPLAMRVSAAGVHFPETRSSEAGRWRRRCPHWIVTAAAHSWRGLVAAWRAGSDAALLGPVFATSSHPRVRPLGAVRFSALSRTAGRMPGGFPVYALGGVTSRTAPRLLNCGAVGLAAISGLSAPGQVGGGLPPFTDKTAST